MKSRYLYALSVIAVASSAFGQMRDWKAVTGQSIKAEFVEIKDGRAVLKTAEGVVTPPLDSLTPECRELAVSTFEKKERQRIAKLTPAQLISAIDPRNYTPIANTVAACLKNPAFDLYVYQPSGIILIFVKEGDAYLSPPLQLYLQLSYHDPAKLSNPDTPRNPLKVLEVNKTQKGVFTIKRQHVDEVVSDVYLMVGKNSVTAGYRVQDPAGIKIPTKHRFTMISPAMYQVSPDADGIPTLYHNPRVAAEGVTRDQLLKMMASWKVDLGFTTKVDGAQTSYSYTHGVDKIPSSRLASMTISGGVYGNNKVNLSPVGSNSSLVACIYKSQSPMDGYQISFSKEDPLSPPESPTALLKIEVL